MNKFIMKNSGKIKIIYLMQLMQLIILKQEFIFSTIFYIYKKILLDCGTLGTIANSKIIIPNKTIKYSEPFKEDIEKEAIAMCTLGIFQL